MKALFAFLLAFAWSANAAISTATKPHTIDSAATPKVSYVDDNDEALLDKINELIDTTNLHNSSGAVVGGLFSSTGDMRLLIDSDNNGTNRWMVTANGVSDTLWRVLESGAWKGFGDGYVSGKIVSSDSLVGATLRATGNLSAGGTLGVTGASTLAGLSATTGSFSSTLGVAGATTLAALSATTGSFSSTLGVDGVATLSGDNAAKSFVFTSSTGAYLNTSNYPGIFSSQDVTGTDPFNSNGHLVLQARTGGTTGRSIKFVTGTTPTIRMVIDPTGVITMNSNPVVNGTIEVTGASSLAALSATTGTFSGALSTAAHISFDGYGTTGTSRIYRTAADGLVMRGNTGSSNDLVLEAADGNDILRNPTGTTQVTFPASGGVTVTNSLTSGALSATTGSFSSNLTQSAGVTTISVTDNTANAVDIQEGSANYINVNTTNSSENVSIGNATTNPTVSLLGTGTKTIDGTINTDLTASRTVVTDGSGNLSVNTETGTGSHMRAASPTTTGTLTGAAANFSGAVSTGALTATTATLGGGEAFTYGDTTFTMTATGMTTSPTGTAYATRIGDVVTLMVPYISGTSNSSSFTFTGIPTGWRPTTIQAVFVPVVTDNSTTMFMVSYGTINSSGVLTLYLNGSSSGWTGSGTKSAQGTITYLLQ